MVKSNYNIVKSKFLELKILEIYFDFSKNHPQFKKSGSSSYRREMESFLSRGYGRGASSADFLWIQSEIRKDYVINFDVSIGCRDPVLDMALSTIGHAKLVLSGKYSSKKKRVEPIDLRKLREPKEVKHLQEAKQFLEESINHNWYNIIVRMDMPLPFPPLVYSEREK